MLNTKQMGLKDLLQNSKSKKMGQTYYESNQNRHDI